MNERFILLAVTKYTYDFKSKEDGSQVKGEGYRHILMDADGNVTIEKFKTPVIEQNDNWYVNMPRVEVKFKTFTNKDNRKELTADGIRVI